MSQKPFSNSTPGSDSVPADLSSDIIKSVQREPGDEVRCVRVGEDKYRCNWWAAESLSSYDNPSMRGGQLGTTYRIRKSSFMRVTRNGDNLQIVEMPS